MTLPNKLLLQPYFITPVLGLNISSHPIPFFKSSFRRAWAFAVLARSQKDILSKIIWGHQGGLSFPSNRSWAFIHVECRRWIDIPKKWILICSSSSSSSRVSSSKEAAQGASVFAKQQSAKKQQQRTQESLPCPSTKNRKTRNPSYVINTSPPRFCLWPAVTSNVCDPFLF